MDKYKTSELGKALKKVYHGEMTVADSVRLAEEEIIEVFKNGGSNMPTVRGVDTGKYGDVAGKCPLCGSDIVRGKYNYGCIGFEAGCNFRIGISICRRDIPISEVSRLLSEGSTATLGGFISKNGKRFDARLVLKDGAAVFSFDK